MKLIFEDEAIHAIAELAHRTNEITEDIGARRLHTVIEKVLEEVSFTANEHDGEEFIITSELVHEKLDVVVEDNDLSRYIL